MRTHKEITAQLDHLHTQQNPRDPFGQERNVLADYLRWAQLPPSIQDTQDAKAWDENPPKPLDVTALATSIEEYMPLAWDIANSADRSRALRCLETLRAWLWILGLDEIVEESLNPIYFGKRVLVMTCEHFGLDWRKWDNGRWRNSIFAEGEPADLILNNWDRYKAIRQPGEPAQ